MFYSFLQGDAGGRFNSQEPRVLCVEADTALEANQRAEFFGVKVGEIECSCCLPRWRSVTSDNDSNFRSTPSVGNRTLQNYHQLNNASYIILYRNNNMVSSEAVPLERDGIPEPATTLPTATLPSWLSAPYPRTYDSLSYHSDNSAYRNQVNRINDYNYRVSTNNSIQNRWSNFLTGSASDQLNREIDEEVINEMLRSYNITRNGSSGNRS